MAEYTYDPHSSGAHANIRREAAEHTSDIRREGAEHAADIRRDVAAQGCDTAKLIGSTSSDIRREVALSTDTLNDAIRVEGGSSRLQSASETCEVIKEGLKGDFNTVNSIKDARYELASRIENNADRLERQGSALSERVADRFFAVGRDLADLRQGQLTLAKDIELDSLKTQLDSKQNTQYLSDKISADGEKTRGLLNDMKYHDLNRSLVERHTELVNCEQDRRHWRHHHTDTLIAQNQGQWGAQFAAMQQQLQTMNQSFNSQLAETRQGMVNFGTMAGVGQSSTNNNVR